jgi:hypothetical protein
MWMLLQQANPSLVFHRNDNLVTVGLNGFSTAFRLSGKAHWCAELEAVDDKIAI